MVVQKYQKHILFRMIDDRMVVNGINKQILKPSHLGETLKQYQLV